MQLPTGCVGAMGFLRLLNSPIMMHLPGRQIERGGGATTDVSLQAIAQHCPELASLDVGGCKNITDAGPGLPAPPPVSLWVACCILLNPGKGRCMCEATCPPPGNPLSLSPSLPSPSPGSLAWG